MEAPSAAMHLDVIGAGPAYTDRPGATGASYLVRLGGASVLLDLGQGSFAETGGHLDPATLDAVVISHLHPDHFIDLVALRHYLRWEKPRRRVRVIGPVGLDARLDALHDEPGFSAASLDVEALTEGTLRVGAFEIQAARVTHTSSSFGFRVSPDGADAERRPRPCLFGRLRACRGPRRPGPPRRHAAVRGLLRAWPGRARCRAPRRPGGR